MSRAFEFLVDGRWQRLKQLAGRWGMSYGAAQDRVYRARCLRRIVSINTRARRQ